MPSILLAAAAFAASATITFLTTPLAAYVARRMGRVAQPRADRWHRTSTPLLGGVAMMLGVAIPMAALAPDRTHLAVLGAAGAAFALGLLDDMRGLAAATKLVGQVLVATVVVIGGISVEVVPVAPLAYLLTVVWIVAVMNAINLLDNMDGLAAGVSTIAAIALALNTVIVGGSVTIIAAVAAGAGAGFLVHNFPPARIFMGDAGSQLLGLLLATAALTHTVGSASGLTLAIAGPLFVLAIPLFDAALVTMTRGLGGTPIHHGGRDHTSHRLASLGLSDRRTILVLYGVTALLAAVGLLTAALSDLVLPLLILSVVGLVLFGTFLAQIDPRASAQLSTPVGARLRSYSRFALEVGLDVALLTAAYFTAFAVRFEGRPYADWSEPFVRTLPIVIALQLAALVMVGMYKTLWRYVALRDALRIVRGATIGTLAAGLLVTTIAPIQGASRAVFGIDLVLAVALLLGARLFLVSLFDWAAERDREGDRTALIVGATEQGQAAVRFLSRMHPVRYRTVGFVDDDMGKRYRQIGGLPILGTITDIESVVRMRGVDVVVIATSDAALADRVDEACERLGIECRRLALT